MLHCEGHEVRRKTSNLRKGQDHEKKKNRKKSKGLIVFTLEERGKRGMCEYLDERFQDHV